MANLTLAQLGHKVDALHGVCSRALRMAEEIAAFRQDFARAIGAPLPPTEKFDIDIPLKGLTDDEFADQIYALCNGKDAIATMSAVIRLVKKIESALVSAEQKREKLLAQSREAGRTKAEMDAATTLAARHTSLASVLRSRRNVALKVFFSVRYKMAKRMLFLTEQLATLLGDNAICAEDIVRAGSLSQIAESVALMDRRFTDTIKGALK